MEFINYLRKPFVVEAVEITEENIEEVALMIAQDGAVSKDDEGKPYILIDRRLVPSIHKAWPGYYMSRFDGKFRVFSPKAFANEFVQMSADLTDVIDRVNAASGD